MIFIILFFIASHEAKTMFARVGDDVKLSCNISSRSMEWTMQTFQTDSPPISIKWITFISPNKQFDNGSLILKSVRLEDTGIYACQSDEINSTDVTKLIVANGLKQCHENFQNPSSIFVCTIGTMVNVNFRAECRVSKTWQTIQGSFGVKPSQIQTDSWEKFSYEIFIKINTTKNYFCNLKIFHSKQLVHVELLKRINDTDEFSQPIKFNNLLVVVIVGTITICIFVISMFTCAFRNFFANHHNEPQNSLLSV